MSKFVENKDGFTLVEIIFSIAFLSVVSVIILQLLVASYEIDNESDLNDIASLKVINEIENAKSIVNIIEAELESKKYFDSDWKLLPTKSGAKFMILQEIIKNNLYEDGLYDIQSSAVDIVNDTEIIRVETKHYYNYKE